MNTTKELKIQLDHGSNYKFVKIICNKNNTKIEEEECSGKLYSLINKDGDTSLVREK